MRRFCCVIAVALAASSACRAGEAGGATLVRKCDAYLYGANRGSPSGRVAQDAAYCAGFIDATMAAARLAHARRGLLLPTGAPPGKVDERVYRAFAASVSLGGDTCLPEGLTTWEAARRLHLMASLNRELLWTDELTALKFVLAELYPCKPDAR